MFNGADQQQLTVFMPNPLFMPGCPARHPTGGCKSAPGGFVTPEDKIAEEPDWSCLSLWNQLRESFLGLQPDPIDRTAPAYKNA